QHRRLGGIGIGDEAAVEDVGGTRHIGDRGADHAAGAAFGRGDPVARRARGGEKLLRLRHRPMTPCQSPAAATVASPAKSPAQRSSVIVAPAGPLRSAQPTGPGFQMSKRRKKRKGATQPGQAESAQSSMPRTQKAAAGNSSAIHWPATSSMTISDGSLSAAPATVRATAQ